MIIVRFRRMHKSVLGRQRGVGEHLIRHGIFTENILLGDNYRK